MGKNQPIHLRSSLSHCETDWNNAMLMGALTAAMILLASLHCIKLRWTSVQ